MNEVTFCIKVHTSQLTRSFESISALLRARMLSVSSRSSSGSTRIPSGIHDVSI